MRYAIRLFQAYRPAWTKPFVEEAKAGLDETLPTPDRRQVSAPWALFAVSTVGLTIQVIAVLLHPNSISSVYPAIAWVCNATNVYSIKRL